MGESAIRYLIFTSKKLTVSKSTIINLKLGIYLLFRKFNRSLRKLDFLNNVSYIKMRVFRGQIMEKYT